MTWSSMSWAKLCHWNLSKQSNNQSMNSLIQPYKHCLRHPKNQLAKIRKKSKLIMAASTWTLPCLACCNIPTFSLLCLLQPLPCIQTPCHHHYANTTTLTARATYQVMQPALTCQTDHQLCNSCIKSTNFALHLIMPKPTEIQSSFTPNHPHIINFT